MRLLSYKVSDFRSVKDSGRIAVDDVTAFVGVNESGKTNLLLPLWKFKPAKEGAIEPTSDYPKNNYASIRADPKKYTFIRTEFLLEEFAEEFGRITGYPAAEINRVEITRGFDGLYRWSFPDVRQISTLPAETAVSLLKSLKAGISDSKELSSESGLKQKVLTAIDEAEELLGENIDAAHFEKLRLSIASLYDSEHAKSSVIHPRLRQAYDDLTAFGAPFFKKIPTEVEGAFQELYKKIPVFLYYSNYGNLDSEIYLPHVVENLARKDLGDKEAAKARTLRVLFSFVGLDPNEILELGRDFQDPDDPDREPDEEEIEAINKKKKERSILLQSAGTKLTTKFKEWWKQGDYRFRFEADGDHFRIWVSDDRRPEEVELEGRSAGLQWFLSFYLVFLVESEGEHKNAVLLLDEPGLSLHPLAQRNLSDFFISLSVTNQIIFTTHSPFLVDADSLEQARKIYVSEDGSTKATSNLNEGESRKSQPGASYALNSALNLSIAESLLLGCTPVIVEGPSDQYIFSGIKILLIGGGLIKPARELVFPPGGGAKSVKTISSILFGRDERLPVVVLDDDAIGRSASKDLKQELYRDSPGSVLNVSTFTGMEGSEVEDLVPTDILISVIDREYRPDTSFEEVYEQGKPILPQIEDWARSNDVDLEKGWKVAVASQVKKRLLARGLPGIDPEWVQMWQRLFDAFTTADSL